MSTLDKGPSLNSGQRRLGAFGGVFTPSILTILGVIMYLRFGWVVGNAGLGGALLIVVLAHLISFATGFSVASIATNRTVGQGGAYFMISRSLGVATGAAIGIPLFFSQALSVTFYIVGFTESLSLLLPSLDSRLLGTLTCAILAAVSLRSTELVIRVQYFVMAAIGLSLVSLFLGGPQGGAIPIRWWNPEGESFSTVFAVFFPAVTGIMAGVSMSGDIEDPRRNLPRGTLMAISVGMIVYLAFPVWLARNASQEALIGNFTVVWDISRLPSLIYLGVWGATLSSAMGSILAAPRTLQALAMDGVGPSIFARGHGASNEPRFGLIGTFLLAEVGILLGNLDIIAPILTMFFLVTYGVTNLAFGLERWAANPSFRPTFKVPSWVGLLGAGACFYVMSIINLVAMLVALGVCAAIFILVKRRTFKTTYGSAWHGIWSATVLAALQRLRRVEYHPINWRPNLMILGGNLEKRSHLLELGSAIVQDRGMVTYLHLMAGSVSEQCEKRKELLRILDHQFSRDYPNVFCRVDIAPEFYRCAVSAVQAYGIGTFEANAVMLGWTKKLDRAPNYFQMLRELSDLDRSLFLVKFHPERGFGLAKRIDIWWRGLENNGMMMLLVAFLLTSQRRWRDAEVRIITVVDSLDKQQHAESRLAEVLQSTRLDASPRVLVRTEEPIGRIMLQESAQADLALVGFRLPRKDASASEFVTRFDQLIADLPTTILVSSAPSFRGAPVLFDPGQQSTKRSSDSEA